MQPESSRPAEKRPRRRRWEWLLLLLALLLSFACIFLSSWVSLSTWPDRLVKASMLAGDGADYKRSGENVAFAPLNPGVGTRRRPMPPGCSLRRRTWRGGEYCAAASHAPAFGHANADADAVTGTAGPPPAASPTPTHGPTLAPSPTSPPAAPTPTLASAPTPTEIPTATALPTPTASSTPLPPTDTPTPLPPPTDTPERRIRRAPTTRPIRRSPHQHGHRDRYGYPDRHAHLHPDAGPADQPARRRRRPANHPGLGR